MVLCETTAAGGDACNKTKKYKTVELKNMEAQKKKRMQRMDVSLGRCDTTDNHNNASIGPQDLRLRFQYET